MNSLGQRIRILERRFLKSDLVDEYRRYHDNAWTELEDLYRKYGITALSCFLNETELGIYIEYDPAVYIPLEEELKANPVEQKWQAIMREFNDSERPSTRFEEVYRLPDEMNKGRGVE